MSTISGGCGIIDICSSIWIAFSIIKKIIYKIKKSIDSIADIGYNNACKEVLPMEAKKKIQAALGYAGISQAELARRLGITPQQLSSRIATGKFTLSEWERIAGAMGAKLTVIIEFPDGGRI